MRTCHWPSLDAMAITSGDNDASRLTVLLDLMQRGRVPPKEGGLLVSEDSLHWVFQTGGVAAWDPQAEFCAGDSISVRSWG